MAEAAELELDEPEAPADEVVEEVPVEASEETPPDEPEEVTITIGEESPPSEDDNRAPDWVRELRKTNRELKLRNRELEALAVSKPAEVAIGDRPKLIDFAYDEEEHGKAVEAWTARKLAADQKAAAKQRATEVAQAAWEAKQAGYSRASTLLKVKDFADAEEAARDVLSVTQQGVIVHGFKDPSDAAKMIYALGKNPAKAKELAALTDPVEFAVAIGELKTMLKETPRRTAPLPERTLRGSAPISGTVDSALERLRAEAEKSGDMTKVVAYKNQLKAKQRAKA